MALTIFKFCSNNRRSLCRTGRTSKNIITALSSSFKVLVFRSIFSLSVWNIIFKIANNLGFGMKVNTIGAWTNKEILLIDCTCLCNAFYAQPTFAIWHFYWKLWWIFAFKTKWLIGRLNCKFRVRWWGIIFRFNYYLFRYCTISTEGLVGLAINDLVIKLLSVFAVFRNKLCYFNFWFFFILFYLRFWLDCYHFRD